MSKETISTIRQDLQKLTFKLLENLKDRSSLVFEIAKEKEGQAPMWMFDPRREIEVFNLFRVKYQNLSLEELFVISFIIESQAHAASGGQYPRWSQSLHLNQAGDEISDKLNPLLLKCFYPERCSVLSLRPEFEYLRDL